MSACCILHSSLTAVLLAAGLTACGPDQSIGGPSPGSGGPSAATGSGSVGQQQGTVEPGSTGVLAQQLPSKGQGLVSRSFRFPEAAAATSIPSPGTDRPVLKLAGPVRSESPLSLTASDGTGLKLVALKANGVVEEPLAFTELQMVFENPQSRVIEGNFKIALPQGATVSRFAMKIGDRWQEGEVVERQAARRAYEDFLHRRQDPALLEQQAGNEFSARVFPIPARGTKELILSYSQELVKDAEPYRIHLQGLPELGSLQLRVLLAKGGSRQQPAGSSLGGELLTHQVIEVSKTGWVPDRDFEVAQVRAADRLGLRNDNLVVARVTPVLGTAPEEIGSLYVLVDTSASRALGHAEQVELVGRLIDGLRNGAGPATPLGVACFDQELYPVFTGKAGDFGEGELRKLRERRPLGASNLQAVLTALPALINKDGVGRFRRVLLITDGVATAGEVGGDRLLEAVRGLRGAEVERLDVIAAGGIRDDEQLGRLVTAGLAHDGTLIEASLPLPEIARKLTQTTRSGIKVNVEGAAWVWPAALNGVQAGDQVLIYADLPVGQPFALALDGVAVAADRRELVPVERPLLERAWVKARIARVLHQRDTLAAADADLREALRKQVIELSTRYRVLSPYTALLVLETEQDYARFGIDRNALADILTIGPTGVAVLNRSAAGMLATQPLQVVTAPVGAKVGVAPPGRTATGRRLAREGEDEAGEGDTGRFADRSRRGAAAPAGAPAETASSSAAMPSAARPAPDRTLAGDEDREEKKAEEADEPARAGLAAGPRGGGAAPDDARRDVADGAPLAQAAMAPPPAPPPPADLPAAEPAPRPAPAMAADRLVATGEGGAAADPGAVAGTLTERTPAAARREELANEVAGRSALRLIARPREERPAPARPPRVVTRNEQQRLDPYVGPFKEVMDQLARQRTKEALARAWAWRQQDLGDVMALVAMGEALEAAGDPAEAARAYGSLIDLFPARADMRRFAGERLERLRNDAALELAIDTYRKAVEQRPDHPASHRLLAFALLRAGRPQEAFRALVAGVSRQYPGGRFAGVDRILREDLGLAAAAWIKAAPAEREQVLQLLSAAGGALEGDASLRFVLNWETDANDVDFHIFDGQGGHAYYQAMNLPSGGTLYADVTTGYGPECFTIRANPRQRAYPYRLQAHYYSRGPMGYGMGKLQVVEHDGKGGLAFEERPFVVMQDQAFVDLGTIKQPLK